MKNRKICAETFKTLVDKRFKENKNQNAVFGKIMFSIYLISFLCVSLFHCIYQEPKYTVILMLCLPISPFVIVPLLFFVPGLLNLAPKYKIIHEIECSSYYDELSKIFDFNCEYTKTIVLKKRLEEIKSEYLNQGFLKGSLINTMIDEIIMLKKYTIMEKEKEDKINKIREKNKNLNALTELKGF